jgi:hypothetical protein
MHAVHSCLSKLYAVVFKREAMRAILTLAQ